MSKKEPLYPHMTKGKLPPTVTGPASLKRWARGEQERKLVALTRDELDILEGVVRHELGLITKEELKAIILKATGGKASWEGGLNPLLTVLYFR